MTNQNIEVIPHAIWKLKELKRAYYKLSYVCSHCGGNNYYQHQFCPNCGCYMTNGVKGLYRGEKIPDPTEMAEFKEDA